MLGMRLLCHLGVVVALESAHAHHGDIGAGRGKNRHCKSVPSADLQEASAPRVAWRSLQEHVKLVLERRTAGVYNAPLPVPRFAWHGIALSILRHGPRPLCKV
jgi:hypothetical protein